MTIKTALLQGAALLEDASVPVPRLTAEVLLSHALRCERVYLFAHPERELREVASRRNMSLAGKSSTAVSSA